jgi:predicted RecB family nuclease
MSKTITSEILAAYSQCPRKAYLLLCTRDKGTPHEYVDILEQQRQTTQRKYINILQQKNVDVQSYDPDKLKSKYQFLVNATLEVNGLAAKCAILNKIRIHSALGHYSYTPTIFVGTHNIKKEQKLEMYFVSHVLEQLQNKRPAFGQIVRLDGKSHKVKLENSEKNLIPILESLQEWAADPLSEPPPLILNNHCFICQFRNLCRAKAEQEDNLSLLDSISASKAINKYEDKGIFTIKQLSYTFKPRKRKKRAKNPPPVTHKPELQTLAIREGKIYLQELPDLTRYPLELFLDIEGVPNQQLYYLIGLLISINGITTYQPFWADTLVDEAQMWQQFLVQVSQYPDVPIYHYGSFEPHALGTLTKRYDTDSLSNRLINVNKHIFGKVYFPTYSNRLKEIGAFVGATWTSPNASGLQSLVWRHHWEETRNTEYKNLLLTYNREDCQALKLLTDELSRIKYSADTLSEIDYVHQPKRHATEIGKEVHSQFEIVLQSAQGRYAKRKISFRPDQEKTIQSVKARGSKKGYQGQRRVRPKPLKVIHVPKEEFCPRCDNEERLQPTKGVSKRLAIDLVLTKNGVRKTIIEYIGEYGYCRKCSRRYAPSEVRKYGRTQLYGHGFKAWFVYHRVALRLPYERIADLIWEQFNEEISWGYSPAFVRDMSHYYAKTEADVAERILKSPFVHADETPINIRGFTQYVWVFTDGKYCIFRLRESRESAVVQEFLNTYKGVLISDFYAAYDSIKCVQQKCWVHLIRELNDDLYHSPFDAEFESFVLEVKNLFIPIMETVQKYGLKKWNLHKFQRNVETFYKTVIVEKRYKSEIASKYQKRFTRYRDSLFTFLEHDGIPWHNNTAERTIRHVVKQQAISGNFHESVTHHYLSLLGIRQACRFQGKSFLKFLFSGETNLDEFEAHKRNKLRTN